MNDGKPSITLTISYLPENRDTSVEVPPTSMLNEDMLQLHKQGAIGSLTQ